MRDVPSVPSKLYFCPVCERNVKVTHFTCSNIAKATANTATGAKKRRSPEHYRKMVEARLAAARRAKLRLR